MQTSPGESNPSKMKNSPSDRLLAGVLSWLVPGAGYWLLGFKWRAVLLGTLLLGIFWTGECLIGGFMAVTYEVHPVFFCLQAGNGLSTFIANGLWGAAVVNPDNIHHIQTDLPPYLNLGLLFCVVSGMLNILLVLHVLDVRTWNREERHRPEGPVKTGKAGD